MRALVAFWCLFSLSAFAQKQGQELIDSLIKELPKIQNDTLKARTYRRIADELFFIDTDKALYYSQLGLHHTTKMPWKRGIGVFTSAIGRAYSDKGMYDSCQYYFQKALVVYREIDDKWNMASTYNNLSTAEQNIVSNYPKATQYLLEALKIAEQINDKYLMTIGLGNLSNLYLAQKNHAKALDYAFRSLKLARQQVDTPSNNAQREVGNALRKVAAVYSDLLDYKNAQKYIREALTLFQITGDLEGQADAYNNLAITYNTDLDSKIKNHLKAYNLWNQVNPMHSEAISNVGNLGEAYFEKAQQNRQSDLYRQATYYINIAIQRSQKKGEISNESYWRGELAELQAAQGDYRNAYLNFQYFHAVQDSLFSQENKNKIAGLESQREIEIRDKQIKINELELDNQKRQRIGLWVGVGLLAVIGGLLYWQNQTRKRTNTTLLHLNHELDEANKVKAKFFAILSHDLRSPVANLISFLNLQKQAPDLLTPEITAAHQQRITAAAEGLLDTMEAMLLWSKSQMENFKPQVKKVPVSELFDYLEKFFAGQTSVALSFENSAHLTVVTDEDYLKIILQNLTNNAFNALKNNPNGQVHWQARQINGQVVLSITDNAGGVLPEQLTALYDDTASMGTKTGLGLHLIRDMARAIACKITVHPTPNVGTEFQLVFG